MLSKDMKAFNKGKQYREEDIQQSNTPSGERAGMKNMFETNYTELTNDQPIHICIKIDKNILIKDIARKIMQIKEVNIDLDRTMKKQYS